MQEPKTPIVKGKSIKLMSRSELQGLFKTMGLKGANAKNADLIEALKTHMTVELENKDFDEAAKAAEPIESVAEQQVPEIDVIEAFVTMDESSKQQQHDINVQVLNEEQCESAPVVETNASSTQATLAVTITEAEAVAVALTVEDIEKTEFDEIKEWLEHDQMDHLIPLFDVEELNSWAVISKLNIDLLRRLGLSFGVAIKLQGMIEKRFPETKQEKMALNMAELKKVVTDLIISNKSNGKFNSEKSSNGLSVSTPKAWKLTAKSVVQGETKINQKRPTTAAHFNAAKLSQVKPKIDSNLRKDETQIFPRSNSSGSMKENSLPAKPVGLKKPGFILDKRPGGIQPFFRDTKTNSHVKI